MTDLAKCKTKMRATVAAWERHRQLIVELDPARPAELLIRESGRRKGYWVPFAAIYTTGARIAAQQAAKEREERRKLKRAQARMR